MVEECQWIFHNLNNLNLNFFPPNLETTPGPLVPPKPYEKKQILETLESSIPPSFEDVTTNSQSNFPSLESEKFDDKEIKRKIKK